VSRIQSCTRSQNAADSPGDPDFERLYRRRNDAESIDRHLDDTLWLRRAHSVGHLRQTLNVLTYALGINALAVHLHRQRQNQRGSSRESRRSRPSPLPSPRRRMRRMGLVLPRQF